MKILFLALFLSVFTTINAQDLNDSIYVNRMVQIVDSLKIERLNVQMYRELCDKDYQEIMMLRTQVAVKDNKITRQKKLTALFAGSTGVCVLMLFICLII